MTKKWSVSWATATAVALAMFALANPAAAQEGQENQRELKSSDFVARDAQGNVTRRDDAAGFGQKGQWTISTDAALSFERRTQSGTAAVTTLSILPATDYFIMKNFSIGGVIGMVYQKAGDTKATAFKIGPRVGYNVEFSRLVSFWPKVGFSYAWTKNKHDIEVNGTEVTRSTKNNAVQLNIFAPVMLHPASHFFVGFGPFIDTDLNGDHRVTIWGLRLTVGGWM